MAATIYAFPEAPDDTWGLLRKETGEIGEPLTELRWAAALGYLVDIAGHPHMAAAAYALVLPLTFERHTRPLELRRGHHACARSFTAMPAACLDRFHDDVVAVRDHLLRRSTKPIANVEGWVVRSLRTATVDGYRGRRGRVGALHKANVPKRLAAALNDPWLVELARLMLAWVGIPMTAGTSVWPTESWAELRAQRTGDPRDHDPVAVAYDIERVVTIMKAYDAAWYARYIELPLGHKQLPVVDEPADGSPEPELTDRVEVLLQEAAAMTVESMRAALAAGEEPGDAVRRALGAFREDCLAAPDDITRAPHATGIDDAVNVGLTPGRIEQLVPVVLDILAGP